MHLTFGISALNFKLELLQDNTSRDGEWYPGNRGSRKILARCWNLGNVSTKSQRLFFFPFLVQKSLGSNFKQESWRVLNVTIRHP